MSAGYEIHRVAERALLVRFLDADLARAVARAHAVLSLFRDPDQGRFKGEKLPLRGEWIPGAGNLLVRFDDSEDAALEADAVEAFRVRLDEILRILPFDGGLSRLSNDREIEIEVAFGREQAGDSGADLEAVAAECGLPPAVAIERFCAATYTVAFVGFSPGFPYLIGLPPELEVARLAAPRPRVPAGSVAIAGPFAGVYPSATPGGWRLLGRSDARLFDPAATPPARLVAGDRVRFVAR